MIHAKKTLAGKVIKRTFTKAVWDRMGKSKNGWSINPAEKGKGKDGVIPTPTEIVPPVDEKVTPPAEPTGSQKGTVAEAIVEMKKLANIDEVKAFVLGDDRAGVVKATAKRIAEIEGA